MFKREKVKKEIERGSKQRKKHKSDQYRKL